MDYNEYLASRLAKLAEEWETLGLVIANDRCLGYAQALRDLAGNSNGLGDLEIYHNEWKRL